MVDVAEVDLMGRSDWPDALGTQLDHGVVRDVTGPYYILRHADVERLAHAECIRGVGLSFFDLMGIADGPLRRWYGSLMFTNEGESHHRLRRLVSKAFTPRSVEAVRESTRQLVATEVASLLEAGEGDLVEQFQWVPMRVMCRLIGVPEEDVPTFADWANALSVVFNVMTPDQIDAATTAIEGLLGYVDGLVQRGRDAPGDDLVTALLTAEDGGETLSRQQVLDMVANLIVGGHDTTASQIGCSLHYLLTHDEAMAAVASHPELVGAAVNETIRLEPGIVGIPRTTAEAIEVTGVPISAGSILILMTAVANREPGVWSDPDDFVIDRFTRPETPRLLSFGIGAHYCLGAQLARMTLEETLRAVAGRVELTVDPSDIAWRVVLGRSPATLRVRVRAA